ncbi:MAG: D-alanine--D-alanine ligase [Candidatus Cloacimonas sp.]|jgi:D-alanine-D-alanine ligase|nr:D-alanine--D-alanine ligase [Candidatus Cloacimonas sp.]
MNKIVVVKGGDSPEREVSLVSGAEIAAELRISGYKVSELDPQDFPSFTHFLGKIEEVAPLLVFNGMHGGSGENGELQAALSLAGYACTGSDSKACSLSMDKYISKLVVGAEGIPLARHILLRGDLLDDYQDPLDYASFGTELGLPIIVKPNDAGSSVGISLVQDITQLKEAVKEALKFSASALLEEYIPGRELTVTVIDGNALPIVEIKPRSGWYDYVNKYTKGKTEYIAPANLEEPVARLVQLYALRVWKALGLSGYARIDFRYDGQKPYFLEANTLPGMTPLSLTPMAAKANGMSFGKLLETIIEISLRKAGR